MEVDQVAGVWVTCLGSRLASSRTVAVCMVAVWGRLGRRLGVTEHQVTHPHVSMADGVEASTYNDKGQAKLSSLEFLDEFCSII